MRKKKAVKVKSAPGGKESFPGYPHYSSEEDIYKQEEREQPLNKNHRKGKIERLQEEMNPEDLDVPGSELDDAEEAIGEEDEENNYYSLGGDDHDDLEEDR